MKENNYPKKLTIRVTQDQYDFLDKLVNASEWMRNAIDSKMFEETTDVLAIVRRIRFLEKEKQRIYNSEEYRTAKSMINVNFAELRRNIIGENQVEPKNVPFEFAYEAETQTINYRIYQVREFNFTPIIEKLRPIIEKLITQTDLQDFINENNLQPLKEYCDEVAVKFLEKVKDKLDYMRKVHKKCNSKTAEIQKEINSLKNKMKTITSTPSQLSIKESKK